ncbi:MAG: transcriptional regulator, TetR family [Rhodospirillales bacterium]|jgi:TetR/AcrR family transcriptional repressor of nem operon|nr:transcriptional regulator, TetR family [Rhodospirillales bacterium]
MRLTKAQRAENHDRIIDVAARLFREKGVDGVGIDEIMEEAGLTHGAFYGHFPSKTALVAEAGAHALDRSGLKRLEGDIPPGTRKNFSELARNYLSVTHRDDPGDGCAIAALAADIGRQDESVRALFARHLDANVDELAERLPGDRKTARSDAIVKYATMVGALVMARSVGKGQLSEELLDTVRERLEIDQERLDGPPADSTRRRRPSV